MYSFIDGTVNLGYILANPFSSTKLGLVAVELNGFAKMPP